MSADWDCQLFLMDVGGWHVASCHHVSGDDDGSAAGSGEGRLLQVLSEYGDDLAEAVRTTALLFGVTPVYAVQAFEGGMFIRCAYGARHWKSIPVEDSKSGEMGTLVNPDAKEVAS